MDELQAFRDAKIALKRERSRIPGGVMIEQIAGKWKGFRQMVNNWLFTMDADPLEDIHNRLRRLERPLAIGSQAAGRRRGRLLDPRGTG